MYIIIAILDKRVAEEIRSMLIQKGIDEKAIVWRRPVSVFEYFIQKKGKAVLENFSLAASMLIAMAGAVIIGML